MITDQLIKEFLQSPIGQNVALKLKAQNTNELYLHGITDSAKGFFLDFLISSTNKPILYLANDTNSALSLYHEIKNLTNQTVLYFPAQEVSPYDQISSDTEVISHQLKTITFLLNETKPALIISCAKYLLEKIWNKEELKKYCFNITLDTKIEPLELTRKLVELGYKKAQTVNSRGEFSLRGDIFDVCPLIGEPTRIEFFGDAIESIRTYSPTTQRSQENIASLAISPRYYIVGAIHEFSLLKNRILQITKDSNELKDIAKKEIEEIEKSCYFESIEYYSQLVNQRSSSLFDYLNKETVLIIDDFESNTTLLESFYKRNLEIKDELEKSKKIILLPELLLWKAEGTLNNLKRYKRVFFERFDFLDKANEQSINIPLTPTLRFNNQIEKFANALKDWISQNKKIIIFSDQPQRIKGILTEWEISCRGVPRNAQNEEWKDDQNLTEGSIFIAKEGTTAGFNINNLNTIVLTDQEIFGTKRKAAIFKKSSKYEKHNYYTNIEDLKPNDFVAHINHGIGRYRGLVKITIDNNEREYLMIEYACDGKLYLPVEQINLLYRYRGSPDVAPKLSKLGGSDWELTKKKVKKAVKRVAEDLLNLYTARAKLEGFAHQKDSHWQIQMEEAFPYTETPDQWQAICDVKKDLESTKPMDRLICGDVGFGKTEVAIRAAFKAILSGKQAAVLVPTTILAQQHFNVMSERLTPFAVRIGLLSRFKSLKEQKEIVFKLALGEIDLVIGTHRLLQNDVQFRDLGLVIIDEEQRFGVLHKERLKRLRVTVDVLTLSATPIPRTLHMALTGARDMSLINTPPMNRLPIKTFVHEFKPSIIKTAILHELERNGQLYFVHNRIETIQKTAAYLKELTPEAQIAVAHGQMDDKGLENVMFDFSMKKFNVLVCTTIIESGLDIPNVNTIIVDNSDHMGLAQLYQLRGRVGRSEVQAYAHCIYYPDKVLSEAAKSRLQAIKEFSTLGSGYQIALRDMEIRGVGNVLGQEQHGHMVSVGFDFYCQLLNEAVDKLRGLEVHDAELECVVDLNISAYIPNTYIEEENQKVIEYKRLANVRTQRGLEYLREEWKDRFGNLPSEAENLIKIVDIRILASQTKIKNIKSDPTGSGNIKIEISLRLDMWLTLKDLFPKKIAQRAIFKSGARGGSNTSSFVLLKTLGLEAKQQLDLLYEFIQSLKAVNINEKIA